MILNEMEYAKNLVDTKQIHFPFWKDAAYLCRFFWSRYDNADGVFKEVSCLLVSASTDYDPIMDSIKLKKMVGLTKDRPLTAIDGVPVTKREIDIIQSIRSRKEQRLLFTLLCLAKFAHMKQPNNTYWVNTNKQGLSSVFQMANIRICVKEQNLMLRDLYSTGLCIESKLDDSSNIRVTFIDENDDSPVIMDITCLEDCGLYYRQYCGEKFIRCQKCGRLSLASRSDQQYCKKCAKEIHIQQTISARNH